MEGLGPDNYDVRNGVRQMGMWVRIFSITDCILFQPDIMTRKFQLTFPTARQIMILAQFFPLNLLHSSPHILLPYPLLLIRMPKSEEKQQCFGKVLVLNLHFKELER